MGEWQNTKTKSENKPGDKPVNKPVNKPDHSTSEKSPDLSPDELAAQQTLESFRPKTKADLTDMALAHKAGILAQAFQGRLPTSLELKNITEELGIELATALFLRTLQDSKIHGPFARQVRAFDFRGWDAVTARAAKIEVAVVASNLFQSGRKWGEHVDDWRTWARDLGFTTDVIETDPRCSVAANARMIFEYLARSPNRRRIIVTYGQGTSEFRYMLHRRVQRDDNDPLPEEVRKICGWINVCGAFAGSSSSRFFQESRVRRLIARLRFKVAGRNPIALAETSSQFPLWRRPLPLIPGIEIASIVGMAYRHRVSASLAPTFNELAKSGPNDGAVSVVEASAHPWSIVAVPGLSNWAENGILEPAFKRTLAVIGQRIMEEYHDSEDQLSSIQSLRLTDLEHKRK